MIYICSTNCMRPSRSPVTAQRHPVTPRFCANGEVGIMTKVKTAAVRLSPDHDEAITRAAEAEALSKSAFIRSSALHRAREILSANPIILPKAAVHGAGQ